MKTPAIVINFKAYTESTGKSALKLAKICDEVAKKTRKSIVICPQLADAQRIAESVKIPVFAQHADPVDPGSRTGWVLIDSLKGIGLSGSLINHSEHRVEKADMGAPAGSLLVPDKDKIQATINKLRAAGMASILCTRNVRETAELSLLKPDFLAIEPPELIGSGVSVSTTKPEVVTGAVDAVKNGVPVLCGAGIATGVDVRKALALGAAGVLLASGVVKAQDQKKVLMDMAESL